MGLNKTGLPDTDDYLLGRGILYFSAIDATTGKPTGGWRDLGNGPSFKISQTTTKLDHTSSRAGLKVVDKSIVTEQKAEVSIELDELNFQNLALAFAGGTATPTNGAIAGFVNYTMIPEGVVLGRWYDLVDSNGRRAYDVTAADITLKKTGGSALVLDDDYSVDTKMGRVFIPIGETLIAGDTVDIALAAKAGAKTLEAVRALTGIPVAGALKFIGQNPANSNKEEEVQIHKIALSADGDVGFISDDIAKITLKGVCESNTGADANSPYFTIITHDNA